MKKIFLSISAFALCGALLVSCNNEAESVEATVEKTENAADTLAAAGSVVYFDLDRVLNEYNLAIDLQTEAKEKVDAIQKDLDRKQKKLQRDVEKFSDELNRNLMTQVVAQDKGQKLQEQKNSLDALVMTKSQEIQVMQQQALDKIAFAINEYLKAYNEEKQFAMIISTQGDILKAPVCLADEKLDITDDIIEGLNEQYANGQQAIADSLATK